MVFASIEYRGVDRGSDEGRVHFEFESWRDIDLSSSSSSNSRIHIESQIEGQ